MYYIVTIIIIIVHARVIYNIIITIYSMCIHIIYYINIIIIQYARTLRSFSFVVSPPSPYHHLYHSRFVSTSFFLSLFFFFSIFLHLVRIVIMFIINRVYYATQLDIPSFLLFTRVQCIHLAQHVWQRWQNANDLLMIKRCKRFTRPNQTRVWKVTTDFRGQTLQDNT